MSGNTSNDAAGRRALIVEDNAGLRALAVQALQTLGCPSFEATEGPAALAILESQPAIELLFTDVMLPGGMDGVALAREATRRRPGLKVLLTSGYAGNSLAGQQELSGLAFIRKPYRIDDLRRRVTRLLESVQ